ncbi:MAG: LLM class flavin-dependent oxidoreductase [Actinobacteria bacterium]|nr:LLM class flavin-dependent oxidoreductase [Actinomycetota bacterium]
MTQFHWFLPSSGDGRNITDALDGKADVSIARPVSIKYLAEVAQAAENVGFVGALTPTGTGCDEAWILGSAVVQHTQKIKPIIAFRPSSIAPAWAAHTAATFQRMADDRLIINIVTGGNPGEQRALGDFLGHDQRYARTDEFLEIFNRCFDYDPFDFEGDHFKVEQASLLIEAKRPPVYFGGASPAAVEVAAKHVDCHLMWGEPREQLIERIAIVKAAAAAQGRYVRPGIRLLIIARDTSDEAWAVADRLLASMDEQTMAQAREYFSKMDSVGQSRMTALIDNASLTTKDLEIEPTLWAGPALVRDGAGTAVVGNYDEVAAKLADYIDIGFEEFILSGYPHLEEAYRVGEEVVPRVKRLRP